jgi:hypothetical protein
VLAVIAIRIVTGGIRTRGLLDGTTPAGVRFASTGRTQLLIATLLAAGTCVAQSLNDPGKFPEIPRNGLMLFGGSHLLYLGSKWNTLRKKV